MLTSSIGLLAVALAFAAPAPTIERVATDSPAVLVALDVPFLAQTDALCGGAAAAMVFRYWGDRHADAQQFAPLVDRRAGGIRDDALVAAVAARGWRTVQSTGSVAMLRKELGEGHPVVILIGERGSRYHYLVVTGSDDRAFIVHDPSRGPSRRMRVADLLLAWGAAKYWSLVILPGSGAPAVERGSVAPVAASPSEERGQPAAPCDRLLAAAVARVKTEGLSVADSVLENVKTMCPGTAGARTELAAVRFVERRWRDAAALAREATTIDPGDSYAWDVLGSTLFLQDDRAGALAAWNHAGKPLVDRVRITGITRSRYQAIDEAIALPAGSLLTERAFRLTERHVEELPDRAASRVSFRPEDDGYAEVEVAVLERTTLPRVPLEWAATAARAAVDREVTLALPGFVGEGELWTASWRWWSGQPRVSLSFATPRLAGAGGTWRVDGGWETDEFRFQAANETAPVATAHTFGSIARSDWLTPDLRYSVALGLDAWTNPRVRAASIGGSIDRRWLSDRLSLALDGTRWFPGSSTRAFHTTRVRAAFRTPAADERWTFLSDAGAVRVSDAAPLGVWAGAGDGHARDVLLRAHPLVHDGAIDGNATFARTLVYGNAEIQRWIPSAFPVRFGFAGFADLARASRREGSQADGPANLDVGLGLRIHVRGMDGSLRLDVAHGLRDGADAVTVGWQSASRIR